MAKRKVNDNTYNIDDKKLRMDLNASVCDKDFVLTKEIVENSVLIDISQKKWRVGKPIGEWRKGRENFIFFSFIITDQIYRFFFINVKIIKKISGKGSFGEIFLASDKITKPVTSENAKYVVKIEPHSNGPLFVEIHCLLNAAKTTGIIFVFNGVYPYYIF